jgi:hypothetical protein
MRKIILLISLLLANTVNAEIYSCSYKSTEGPASDTTDFIRDGKFFKASNLGGKFLIAKENSYAIILVDQEVSDFVVHLKKDGPIDGSINFIDLRDMAQWSGKCLISNIKK